jgi:chromosome segregation ATPase
LEVVEMDEEIVMLEEQLAAAHADIERLQSRVADAESLVETRNEELSSLRLQLTERDSRVAETATEVESLRSAVELARQEARAAVQRVRSSVLEREPELPAELVQGETVPDLDAAIERARQTVTQVRQHLEQQAQSRRVPAGAPVRGAPDTSSMSAAEKIRSGLRGS